MSENKQAKCVHKTLVEMTLEELWELFPIFLTEHKEYWSAWYREERDRIARLLPDGVQIHHIGSTAIKGIWAKPIIDILIETKNEAEGSDVMSILQANGYLLMNREKGRSSLNKGYTESGFSERVFHLHVRLKSDCDELYFRDYLNVHFDVAKKYEALKLDLWKRYEHDRDGYTSAKTEFVKKYTELAKADK